MKISIDFLHNRTRKRLAKDEPALIQCRLYCDRKWKVFSTGLMVTAAEWDKRRRQVKGRIDAPNINRRFESMRQQVTEYANKCFIEGKPVNLVELANILQNRNSERFGDFVKIQLEKSAELQPNTTKQHKVFLKYWNKFNRDADLKHITPKLIDEFETYLLRQRSTTNKKQTLSVNYVAQILGTMKKYVRKAHRLDLIQRDPFEGYEFKREKKENFVLTMVQVKKIYSLDLSERRGGTQERRDAFVFSCLTGLPYADLNGLQRKHITGRAGKYVLTKVRHKTRNTTGKALAPPISVLFDGMPEEVITPYLVGKLPNAKLFKHIDLSTFNKNIKEFLTLAGVEFGDTKIGSHLGRHTCKYLLQEAGMPIQMIAQILGQSEIKTTQGYGKEGYDDIGEAAGKYF